MPELKKRIVIASVLKPLNDTRMTEKMACTLADNPGYDLHVIGFPSSLPGDSRIRFHTFRAFKRLSAARWFASFRILRIVLRLKPDLFMITTHELMLAACVVKIFLRSKIVYDVQENYALNIRHTPAFPKYLRRMIAVFVRTKEWLGSLFVDHFILAEKIYATQLRFPHDPFTIVENKVKETSISFHERNPLELVFTGTLSKTTGLFQVVALAKKLHAVEPQIRLKIVGYVPLEQERSALAALIAGDNFIELIGVDHLVSHDQVMGAVGKAGAGIIAYQVNEATRGRIPTKLYEYMGAGLPVIFLDPDPPWVQLTREAAHPALSLSAADIEPSAIINWLNQPKNRGTFDRSYTWKNEESKLLTAISAL